jgi:beta-N-acetylhexosaminidase
MASFSCGQLILTGVPGPELDSNTAQLFRRVQPAGFILFSRNIKSPRQLRKLIDDLRDISDVEPIITIDQEGGRVSRLREIGNEPPNAYQFRTKGDVELIRRHGHITGRLLRLFGFNLDLCPVLDISFDDEADNSLRGRCYGTSVEQVLELAGAFNEGLRAEGIASCGKHFPGYSAATVDAHHELPTITRRREELFAEELAVFRHFTSEIDSMMICHAFYPSLEPEKIPASLSLKIINELLRNTFGFNGLVMTDDLDMGAIVNQYPLEQAVRLAINAGNDLAMICHRVDVIIEAAKALEKAPRQQVEPGLERVAVFKKHLSPSHEFSEQEFAVLNAEIWNLRVETLGETLAQQRSPEDGKRSPVELY